MSRVRLKVRGVIVAWIGSGVHFLTAFVLTPILLGNLGTSVFGIWQLVMEVLDSSMMIDLGLGTSTVKFLADFEARRDYQSYVNCVATARRANLWQASIALLIVTILSLLFPYIFGIGDLEPNSVRMAALLTGLSSVGTMLGNTSRCILKSKGRFDLTNSVQAIARVLSGGGMAVCALVGGKLVAVTAVGLFATVCVQIVSYILAESQVVVPSEFKPQPDPELRKRMFRFGAFSVATQISQIISSRSGTIILGIVSGPAAIAFFAVASTLAAKINRLGNTMVQGVMPMASGMSAMKDHAKLYRMSVLVTRILMAFSIFAACLLISLGTPLMLLWLRKPDFVQESYLPLCLLSLAFVIRLPSNALRLVLIGLGAVDLVARRAILEGCVTILLQLLFAPFLGPTGVALGALVTQITVVAVAQPIFLSRALNISLSRFFSDAVRPPLLSAIPTVVCAILMNRFWPPTSLWFIGVQMLVLAVSTAIPAWFFCLDGELRKSLLTTANNRGRNQRPPKTAQAKPSDAGEPESPTVAEAVSKSPVD